MSSHNLTAMEVVEHLRAEVEANTGLTISAGIAPNRMLAKVRQVCTDAT
jgi:DNA polymerase kappa